MTLIELTVALCACSVLALLGRLLLGKAGVMLGIVPATLLFVFLVLGTIYAAIAEARARRRNR